MNTKMSGIEFSKIIISSGLQTGVNVRDDSHSENNTPKVSDLFKYLTSVRSVYEILLLSHLRLSCSEPTHSKLMLIVVL